MPFYLLFIIWLIRALTYVSIGLVVRYVTIYVRIVYLYLSVHQNNKAKRLGFKTHSTSGLIGDDAYSIKLCGQDGLSHSCCSLTPIKCMEPIKWTATWQNQQSECAPAKAQISLGVCPVWSESSLCAQWVAKGPRFLHADSEDSDQTGRMPRLVWVFAGRTLTLLSLSCRGSIVFLLKSSPLLSDQFSIVVVVVMYADDFYVLFLFLQEMAGWSGTNLKAHILHLPVLNKYNILQYRSFFSNVNIVIQVLRR